MPFFGTFDTKSTKSGADCDAAYGPEKQSSHTATV